VLEHPIYSRLWDVMELPPPGERDAWGGWTLPVHQFWWGHDCEKRTWLYIVGCEPEAIPDNPVGSRASTDGGGEQNDSDGEAQGYAKEPAQCDTASVRSVVG
jgi:hypothetical protein